jgi:hypothetical protein
LSTPLINLLGCGSCQNQDNNGLAWVLPGCSQDCLDLSLKIRDVLLEERLCACSVSLLERSGNGDVLFHRSPDIADTIQNQVPDAVAQGV